MKVKIVRRIAAAVIAVIVILLIVRIILSNCPRTGNVMFKMHANSSLGEHYIYEFDRDDILREVDSYSSHVFWFLLDYSEVWEFDIIGEGDLTVNWTNIQGGSVVNANCFTEVYRVEDGKCTKISDTRKH